MQRKPPYPDQVRYNHGMEAPFPETASCYWILKTLYIDPVRKAGVRRQQIEPPERDKP